MIDNSFAKSFAKKTSPENDPKNNKLITDKTLKVLADSIYQTLKNEGCEHKDIIGVSSKLIGLVTNEIHPQN